METWNELDVHNYAKSGDVGRLKAILNAENLNLANSRGQTPLMLAALHGHVKAVRILLEAGAHLDLQDIGGSTALMGAAFKGHSSVVEVLMQSGANATLANPQGMTALHFAEIFERPEIEEHLLGSKPLEEGSFAPIT